MLYELLAGCPPFGTDEATRTDRDPDAEPVAPSAAAGLVGSGTGASHATTIAESRSTDPIRLRRRLAGDLDTIVGTALRSAPERRYASVGALHDDLRRHLARLPVRACPDTLGYRLSRFVRRHRAGVIAAGTIVGLLIAFGISTAIQAAALAVERDRARLEAASAREVSEFLVKCRGAADSVLRRARSTLDRIGQ